MQNRIASFLAISAVAFGVTCAHAGELDYPPPLDTASTQSRVEVQQALQAARDSCEIFAGELDPQALSPQGSTSLTRSQVVQELNQARTQGLISRGNLDYPPAHG